MVTLFVSVFWKLECLGVLHLLGAGANQWRHTLLYLFPGAVVEGCFSIWVYRWLDRFDRRHLQEDPPGARRRALGRRAACSTEKESANPWRF